MNIAIKVCQEVMEIVSSIDEADVNDFVQQLDKHKRIFLFGEGRSGLVTRCFAMRLMHMGYETYFVGETITPSIHKEDLFIIVSGSGESAASLAYTREVAKKQVDIVAITKKPTSSIAALATNCIHMGRKQCDFDHSIQPLNSLFDQSLHLVLDAVCVVLSQNHALDKARIRQAHW